MNSNLTTTLIVLVAALILLGIALLQRRKVSFNKLVVLGLVAGLIFGVVTQAVWGTTSKVAVNAIDWISIVGNGYLALLQTLIIPLILISLISAFTKLDASKNFAKITGNVLTVLLGTTAVAAFIGVLSVITFHLQGANFVNGKATKDSLAFLQQHQDTLGQLSLPQKIVSFLPKNIFADLAGTRATSTIAVVIFSFLVGIAYLWLRRSEPGIAQSFAKGVNVLDALLAKLVRLIIQLTPYGIFALLTKTVATNSAKTIASLGIFIIAVYVALALVLVVHTLILLANKVNPITYYKKVWPVLIFAFTSRSSAGSLPLNVDIQKNRLGINQGIADFAASFGLSIGQNGCAGVYPAMVAAVTAPLAGVNITSWQFILTLVVIVTISSFGVAGSGGGATFSALIVLGTLNLPLSVMAIVLAIDPIIDMGRTLVNVNDSILAGLLTAKHNDLLDTDTLNSTGHQVGQRA
ncbi:cation:dicarboxylase symporter family transporter [Lactobacillaceae bacterium L1_55_11]|nr:cation:dicarboxylase symporter family transporter [Lactobacillaceae bacterium L1_55_11]